MKMLYPQDLELAAQALGHVARYDSMRLQVYSEKERLADRIRVAHLGSAVALRFDEVGYFNRVYCGGHSALEALPEIEEFYRGGPFGCEVVGPPAHEDVSGRELSRPGWASGTRYAWMFRKDCNPSFSAPPSPFTIRTPEQWEREQFLITYLRAFEAAEHRIPAALLNMRHLFDRPELDFLMAWHGNLPAGVAMMMRCGRTALLCAGASLPEFREMGCHRTLLTARIQLAFDAGCEQIFSWAVLGGQSQANLERAGLAVVGTTTTWRFSPQSSL